MPTGLLKRPGRVASRVLSVIIPTYNEAAGIGLLVHSLRAHGGAELEIIVADGHSTDATIEQAEAAGARVVRSPRKGRAAQLNAGAAAATGAVLYFLHADSYPPNSFAADIRQAVGAGASSGCYRLAFDDPHWLLRLSAWCTRFDFDAVRFGDQSLFVRREVFARAGGFREELIVMEDQEIIHRLRQGGAFRLLAGAVTTSARKYRANGVVRLQAIFTLIYLLYRLGVAQTRLVQVYRALIRQDKV